MLPIAETIYIMLGIAANHGDEGEEEQREDQDDLASREPELSLAIGFDCKNVNATAFVLVIGLQTGSVSVTYA
jgi:hypothetical protein